MSTDVNKYCAEKLKKLRRSKNMTQLELAEGLGITQQQVARYENNKRQFKQDFLFKLADYFKVSINSFFPDEQDDFDNKNEKYEEILKKKGLMDNDGNINEEDFEKLIDFAIANKEFIIKKRD